MSTYTMSVAAEIRAEMAGHSSPTVTAIYAHTKAEQVRAAADAAATLHLLA